MTLPHPALKTGLPAENLAILVVEDDRDQAEFLVLRLKAIGYDVGVSDGAYGPSTSKAVTDLQTAAGIPADYAASTNRRLDALHGKG